MNRLIKHTLAFLLLLLSLNIFAQGNKVAIPEVVDKEENVPYAIRLMVRSNLTKAISEKQGYAAYDRVDIGTLMDEHSFQRTGLVDDRTIRKLGEMTGCNLVLIAEVASIDSDNYYVSAKIVEIETARTKQIESTLMGASATSIQKGCDELVGKLLGGARTTSTSVRSSNPAPNKAVVLVTGLRVFPYDIGEFNAEPYQTIQSLNQKKTFGYSNWRLPTRDELSLLRANSASLGDLKNEQYMVSNPSSGQVDEISYGGATGWVRLVSDGWTPAEEKELKTRAIREICGIGNDYTIDLRLGIIISPDIRINDISDIPYSAPAGWHMASYDELVSILDNLRSEKYLVYAYNLWVEEDSSVMYGWEKHYYMDVVYPRTAVYRKKAYFAWVHPHYKYDYNVIERNYRYSLGEDYESTLTVFVKCIRSIPDETTINRQIQKYL